jgi:hypothetical protein
VTSVFIEHLLFSSYFVALLALQATPNMAEVIGLGASVVAFICLARQVLQGCAYVREVVDNINDADRNILTLRRDVHHFELTINSVRDLLNLLENPGLPLTSNSHLLSVEAALSTSRKSVEDVQQFILCNYRPNKRRRKLKMVFGKSKHEKCIDKIRMAKQDVGIAQACVIL